MYAKNMICDLLVAILAMMFAAACTHSPKSANLDENIELLSHAITALSSEILPSEANETSRVLLATTAKLTKEYNMASPAKYHNLLVNLGLRRRGLCCHWAEDLHAKLRKIHSNSLDFDWVVTKHGNILQEHNTVIIFSSKSSWENGLIYDPWRNAGKPFWAHVDKDKYVWKRHPLSGKWQELHCE